MTGPASLGAGAGAGGGAGSDDDAGSGAGAGPDDGAGSGGGAGCVVVGTLACSSPPGFAWRSGFSSPFAASTANAVTTPTIAAPNWPFHQDLMRLEPPLGSLGSMRLAPLGSVGAAGRASLGVRLVSEAMMRRFSLLAARSWRSWFSRLRTRSRSSLISSSVRSVLLRSSPTPPCWRTLQRPGASP
jgi:hypothetical protein